MKSRYLLNVQAGVLHRLPTKESCNVDQVPNRFKKRFAFFGQVCKGEAEYAGKLCGHCFPKQTRA